MNRRTRKRGHFAAVSAALRCLRGYAGIDVTICTAATRHNIEDVSRLAQLVEQYAETTSAGVRYEVYQVFPRAMFPVAWHRLLVSDGELAALRVRVRTDPVVSVEFLDHEAVDPPRVMIFPDGRLVIPSGCRYYSYGPFLEITDLGEYPRRGRTSGQDDRHPSVGQGSAAADVHFPVGRGPQWWRCPSIES